MLEKIEIVNKLENNIPPKPLVPRRNFTIATFEKLINKELLLNFMPASTAQKIHIQTNKTINIAKLRCFFNGSNNEYVSLG